MAEKILVTGATGFLGAALTRTLVADGADVRGTKRSGSSTDLLGDAAHAVEWIDADVCDRQSLEPAFDGVDRAFHCPAYLGFDGKRDRDRLMAVNVGGTANVVDVAIEAGIDNFYQDSSNLQME